jgi:hypothetical protein
MNELAREYVVQGFVLVPFRSGLKGPEGLDATGWNTLAKCIVTPDQAARLNGCSFGLAHAYSNPKTCAVDADDLARATEKLSEHRIDFPALLARPDAVQIVSGRDNRAKLIYRLPQGVEPLKSRQFWKAHGRPALELRCASEHGLTFQDVLPPSVHPQTGRPYEWRGDWRNLPELPPELLAFWLAEPERKERKPKAEKFINVEDARVRAELERRVNKIDSNDRETWLRVIWAVGRATRQSRYGLDLVQGWSAKSPNHDPVHDPKQIEKEYLVESAKERQNPVGYGTIVQLSNEAGDNDGRPEREIELRDGKLPEFVDECVEVLAGADVYQRAGQLVHVLRVEEAALMRSEDIRRDKEQLVIAPLSTEALRVKLGRRVSFVRHRGWDKEYVDCPPGHANAIAGQGQWPGMPVLRGIADAPTLRADGSILQTPGYDPLSGLLLKLDGTWPAILDRPTKAEAEAALAKLLEPFEEVPFETEEARSAFASSILTHAVRAALETAPFTTIIAPSPGSGKGLLTDSISMIVGGRRAPKRTLPRRDDEEMRKVITAALMAGDRMLVLDNIPRGHAVDSPALDQAMTSGIWADRILGKSAQIALPFTLSVFLTGNNISFHADAVRRGCYIHLDPKVEHPEERQFKIPDLLGHLLEHRRDLLVAALTILRAYKVAGEREVLTPLGSFEAWSAWVREAIVWLGRPDPVATQQRMRAEDEGQAELQEMLTELELQFNDRPFTGAQVVERLPSSDKLKKIFAKEWDPSAAQVSARLRKHMGQVVGTWSLRGQNDKHTKVYKFQVAKLGSEGGF